MPTLGEPTLNIIAARQKDFSGTGINPQVTAWSAHPPGTWMQATSTVTVTGTDGSSQQVLLAGGGKPVGQKLLMPGGATQSNNNVFIPTSGIMSAGTQKVMMTNAAGMVGKGQNVILATSGDGDPRSNMVFIPNSSHTSNGGQKMVLITGPQHGGKSGQALLLPLHIANQIGKDNLGNVISALPMLGKKSQPVTTMKPVTIQPEEKIKLEPDYDTAEAGFEPLVIVPTENMESQVTVKEEKDSDCESGDATDTSGELVNATPLIKSVTAMPAAKGSAQVPGVNVIRSVPLATSVLPMPMLKPAPTTTLTDLTYSTKSGNYKAIAQKPEITFAPVATTTAVPFVMPTAQMPVLTRAPRAPQVARNVIPVGPTGMPVLRPSPMVTGQTQMVKIITPMPSGLNSAQLPAQMILGQNVIPVNDRFTEGKSAANKKPQTLMSPPLTKLRLNESKLAELEENSDREDDGSLAPISHLVGIAMATTQFAETLTQSSLKEPAKSVVQGGKSKAKIKQEMLELVMEKQTRAQRHKKTFDDYDEESDEETWSDLEEAYRTAKKRKHVVVKLKPKVEGPKTKKRNKAKMVAKKSTSKLSRGRLYRSQGRFTNDDSTDEEEETNDQRGPVLGTIEAFNVPIKEEPIDEDEDLEEEEPLSPEEESKDESLRAKQK